MNPVSFDPAVVCIVRLAALFFLLLGWRLGRESAGRPMFDFPLFPAARQSTDAPDDADPAAAQPTGWIVMSEVPALM